MPANSTMLSRRAAMSRRRNPMIVPLKNAFSRPVSSGWKPEPTSISAARRPRNRISPVLGAVMPESSLNIVLCPHRSGR